MASFGPPSRRGGTSPTRGSPLQRTPSAGRTPAVVVTSNNTVNSARAAPAPVLSSSRGLRRSPWSSLLESRSSSQGKKVNSASTGSLPLGRKAKPSSQSPSPAVSRQSSVTSETQGRKSPKGQVPVTWGPTKEGMEVLQVLRPFQDALQASLGLNRSSCGVSQQPQAKDIQLLQDSCSSLASALSQLQQALGTSDVERPHGADAGTGGATAELSERSEPLEVRKEGEMELQKECLQLQKEVGQLEAHAGRVTDLEQVAEQLRSRVAELKAKENRTELLRCECRNLRVQIAELVAASVHSESDETLGAEKTQLKARLQTLLTSQGPRQELCRGVALPKRSESRPPADAIEGGTGSS